MKCEWVKENISLYLYNELADDARYELEQHLSRCAECSKELGAAQVFHSALSQFPIQEPTPNLLAGSRMRLQEALETAEQGGFWRRLIFDPTVWLREIRFAPALTAAIFIVGFAGGVGATYKTLNDRGHIAVDNSVPAVAANQASVAGIRSVTQDPTSKQVSIQYDTVSAQQAQGSLNDERIQQLLLFAARNNYNSGVRMDSVDLLTKQPNDTHVREALVYALRYDSNPGVRLKALDGVGPAVKEDVRVRDAVLEALMDDSNPGVRIEALRLLEPVRGDGSVRVVLQQLAKNDKSDYIRTQARLMAAQSSEMD
jgi:anti-sigma factor RsiW